MPRMTLPVLILAAILAFVIPMDAMATDYYIDPVNGSDSTGDGSQGNPWATIMHALDSVSGSEPDPATIHAAAGTYAASTNGEAFSLIMESWVSQAGGGSGTTVLDAESAAYHVIYCDGVDNVAISLGCTNSGSDVNADVYVLMVYDWAGDGERFWSPVGFSAWTEGILPWLTNFELPHGFNVSMPVWSLPVPNDVPNLAQSGDD